MGECLERILMLTQRAELSNAAVGLFKHQLINNGKILRITWRELTFCRHLLICMLHLQMPINQAMKHLSFIFILLFSFSSFAQINHIVYKESREDFSNPERGFYLPFGTSSEHFTPLNKDELVQFQTQPQQAKSATYSFHGSLIYRAYRLENYKTSAIDDAFLQKMQADFDAVRFAGLKMILRFSYTDKTHTGDCPDEYKICPPYGDAAKEIVLKHIAQLKPLLQKNADVISVLQMGFIGIWGENYFTDYFGDASTNHLGYVADSSWRDRNEILLALLNALPKDRMIDVRTPQIKQRFVYGPQAPVTSKALTEPEGFSETDKARIGFHNDCFLASKDDYGTFYSYGNSSSKRDTANATLRRYFEQDSRYTAVGGETCDDAFSPQNDCGGAEKEMAAMHYSYLNAAYNNDVNNDWDSGGCVDVIRRSLGYRFVLTDAYLPDAIKARSKIILKIGLKNEGFASPYNPRPLQLILRNERTKTITVIRLKTDIRRWFSGTISFEESITLPKQLEPGRYELLLNMPDAYSSLAERSCYSIRLANESVWEPQTGYNNLNHIITIK